MNKEVPKSLRTWFLIHFIVDIIFAIPLIFFPKLFLTSLGFTIIDTFSARLIGAALFAIGTISLLKNKSSLESYDSLLTLKILWSLAAILGIFLSILEGAPKISWLILATFVIFSIIWIYYKIKLRN